jgi:putative ABC transport system ATP-binding protein
MPEPPLFTFEHVSVAGGERPRLDDVSVTLPDAGVTALAGPSGAGKSTMLRCCNRLEAPDAGTVRYRGEDIASLDPLAHRRAVGMVFQAPVLFPGTVADNIRVADPDADDERVAALLQRAALDARAFAGRDADTLSGGEGQRVCLARTLATDPQVVLMDEPTSALDGDATAELEALMRTLAGDGVPVLLVTHDEEQLGRVADHVLRLREGRIAGDLEHRHE